MRLPFPIDIIPEFETNDISNEHVTTLAEKLEKAYKVVRSHLQQGKRTQEKQYNTRKDVKFKSLHEGDWVFLHSTVVRRGVTKKLSKPWIGPYQVIEKLNDVNYRIQISKDRTQVVHVNRFDTRLCHVEFHGEFP